MDGFDRHVLICEPQPCPEELLEWRRVVKEVAAGILKINSRRGLLAIGSDLQDAVAKRAAVSGQLGDLVKSALERSRSRRDRPSGPLYTCVCAMLGVGEVLSGGGEAKRGVLAVAIWSALSFGVPLTEPRLEGLRSEILKRAQDEAIEMASRARRRSTGFGERRGSPTETALKPAPMKAIKALTRNAALDQEELRVLRWLLADKSRALGSAVADIDNAETGVLAMAMELGQLLTTAPAVFHYQLGRHFVRNPRSLDLEQLIDVVGLQQRRLTGLCPDQEVVKGCPAVFPLMRALLGEAVEGEGEEIGRGLNEWWERALLESSAAVWGGRKGWGLRP